VIRNYGETDLKHDFRTVVAMKQKLRRLREEKDTRRLIAVILGGKMLGIVGVLGFMKVFAWLFESAAWAQSAAPIVHKANDFVSPINTVWVLVTAFLVFFMQAGFMGLEAGFAARERP
jgi:Amt family ammonium transporter